MRLMERNRRAVRIVPPVARRDAFGAVTEDFSGAGYTVRGTLIPATEGLRAKETGELRTATMGLLLNRDAPLSPGDGVATDGGEVMWRVAEVARWSAHIAARLERLI